MSFFVQLPSLTFLKLTHFYYSLCPAKEFLSLGHSHLATNGILKESSHFTWLSTSRQNIFARHEDYAQIVATLWTQSKIMIHETQHSKSSNLVAFLGWVELNSLSKSTFWTKIGLLAWKCSSLRSQYWMFLWFYVVLPWCCFNILLWFFKFLWTCSNRKMTSSSNGKSPLTTKD